ncbi:protein-tyrosine phosphatase-like protein [Flagelloscypha sp. PMI_526]|nr:protein-tyrosine phosphatase-like protein [Flagelloscypha sp. PMI_526]
MDALRVTKVQNVECTTDGKKSLGTLHLTAHHLIFNHNETPSTETWVPYPLISLVTRAPQSLQGESPLAIHLRTFRTVSLVFKSDKDCSDVFDSIKELTVTTSVNKLYAFSYSPTPPFERNDGWNLYSPREEFLRMGLGTRTKAWRFTEINKDYSFCPTYPAKMAVPTRISDTTLQYAGKYRSKCRIPVLTYLHWANYGSITRSSQPMVGLTQNRSIQDEKLIEAIFQSHHSPDSRAGTGPVYGATTTNLIIDARPTVNAFANSAKGAGTENMDHYKEGKKAYLGIDNIHQMRDSLNKVVEALREADAMLATITQDLTHAQHLSKISTLDRPSLRRSGWLRHMTTILEGSLLIIKNIHVNSSHVLIHCSDGWDRTAQLSSVSQLCLDPYYRTIKGFQILVEKDWLSFGHKFLDRCGHLSSEKFFVSEPDTTAEGGGAEAQAFLASLQNRFVGNGHLKEVSPVFHQFLETVRQVQRQFPDRFEFNERFLHQMYYHLYACQFGSFMFNCEKDRRTPAEPGESAPWTQTISVWDWFNSKEEMEKNINPTYDPSLDDPKLRRSGADMGVLFPNPKDVRFWNEIYGRTDEEMNGRLSVVQNSEGEVIVTSPQDDIGQEDISPSPSHIPLPPSPSPTPSVSSINQQAPPRAGQRTADAQSSNTLPPTVSRTDSFRPFENTGSTFTMRTQVGGAPASPPTPRGLKTPDFFTSGAGKNLWGRLSSNASAAFSAVQEAYEGATKEYRGTSPGPSSETRVAGELQSRDVLSGAWGEEPPIQETPAAIPPASTSTSTSAILQSTTTFWNSHS